MGYMPYDLVWTALILVPFVLTFLALVQWVRDGGASADANGGLAARLLWILVIFVIPLIGPVLYLLYRPRR